MRELRKTDAFAKWLDTLTDVRARARILVRLQRLESGHVGDAKAVGSGVSELRIDHGPGYRIYFCQRGAAIVILLAGGTKDTQRRDIQQAIQMAKQIEETA